MKVILDTVVFVRSLINHHSYWGKIVFDRVDQYELVLSVPIIQEILEVLQRPELTKLFHTLPGQDVHRILKFIANAEVVELDTIASISRDIKDDKFLATARVGKALYLVSEDRDLLDIGEYEGTKIITAEAFLRILDESSVEAA